MPLETVIFHVPGTTSLGSGGTTARGTKNVNAGLGRVCREEKKPGIKRGGNPAKQRTQPSIRPPSHFGVTCDLLPDSSDHVYAPRLIGVPRLFLEPSFLFYLIGYVGVSTRGNRSWGGRGKSCIAAGNKPGVVRKRSKHTESARGKQKTPTDKMNAGTGGISSLGAGITGGTPGCRRTSWAGAL